LTVGPPLAAGPAEAAALAAGFAAAEAAEGLAAGDAEAGAGAPGLLCVGLAGDGAAVLPQATSAVIARRNPAVFKAPRGMVIAPPIGMGDV